MMIRVVFLLFLVPVNARGAEEVCEDESCFATGAALPSASLTDMPPSVETPESFVQAHSIIAKHSISAQKSESDLEDSDCYDCHCAQNHGGYWGYYWQCKKTFDIDPCKGYCVKCRASIGMGYHAYAGHTCKQDCSALRAGPSACEQNTQANANYDERPDCVTVSTDEGDWKCQAKCSSIKDESRCWRAKGGKVWMYESHDDVIPGCVWKSGGACEDNKDCVSRGVCEEEATCASYTCLTTGWAINPKKKNEKEPTDEKCGCRRPECNVGTCQDRKHGRAMACAPTEKDGETRDLCQICDTGCTGMSLSVCKQCNMCEYVESECKCKNGGQLSGVFICDNHEWVDITCVCANGIGAEGSACTTHGTEKCVSCQDGYTLTGTVCKGNQCTCQNGDGATGADCPTDGDATCASCKVGYTLSDNVCKACKDLDTHTYGSCTEDSHCGCERVCDMAKTSSFGPHGDCQDPCSSDYPNGFCAKDHVCDNGECKECVEDSDCASDASDDKQICASNKCEIKRGRCYTDDDCTYTKGLCNNHGYCYMTNPPTPPPPTPTCASYTCSSGFAQNLANKHETDLALKMCCKPCADVKDKGNCRRNKSSCVWNRKRGACAAPKQQ